MEENREREGRKRKGKEKKGGMKKTDEGKKPKKRYKKNQLMTTVGFEPTLVSQLGNMELR